jgi:phosphopantothenoylcysteine decarboxylase / phosphopantothenate---cysteine ligase
MAMNRDSQPPRLLITAGPTHEPIDRVRYIANRSSGRLGIALAQAGREAGWDVTLLLGPVEVAIPPGVAVRRFTTTADLARLLDEHFPRCHALIMAAAVADYRPKAAAISKLPRESRPLTLELEPTPDLLAGCAARRRNGQLVIGFALEPAKDLPGRAADKLRRKKIDAIIANPLETMGSESIHATLIRADGRTQSPGPLSKPDFARWLFAQLKDPN